jgi:integrase
MVETFHAHRHTRQKPQPPGLRSASVRDPLQPWQAQPCFVRFSTAAALSNTCAWLLTRNGANVKLVQARLGHKSATETLDTYGHLWPDADEQTRNILNNALTTLRKPDVQLRVLDEN